MCKQSEKFLTKKIDFIYLIYHRTPTASLFASGCVVGYDKVQTVFVKNFERPCTYTASSERTFEVGLPEAMSVPSKVQQKIPRHKKKSPLALPTAIFLSSDLAFISQLRCRRTRHRRSRHR